MLVFEADFGGDELAGVATWMPKRGVQVSASSGLRSRCDWRDRGWNTNEEHIFRLKEEGIHAHSSFHLYELLQIAHSRQHNADSLNTERYNAALAAAINKPITNPDINIWISALQKLEKVKVQCAVPLSHADLVRDVVKQGVLKYHRHLSTDSYWSVTKEDISAIIIWLRGARRTTSSQNVASSPRPPTYCRICKSKHAWGVHDKSKSNSSSNQPKAMSAEAPADDKAKNEIQMLMSGVDMGLLMAAASAAL
ncbi:hypothetical protein SEPCBS119000_005667 [Sporothrix epigloea]|uniref:Uncharacterized protein n=1 Tax=Sporothrix epigloea TaxID=1892477 RepID=A0ABP0DYT6_9PEZI